jgi:multidrug resistance protein, MATE family
VSQVTGISWSKLTYLDGLNGSQGGALRGAGRQHIGALVNIISYYCLALPLGIYLAFDGWRLHGLWIGQCVALYLVGFAEWAIVAFSDWEKEVRKALARLDDGEVPADAVEA